MTIEATIVADSISPAGIRLTTFQLRYPRFIHAEELTHRILETTPECVIYESIPDGLMYDPNLSRNASSSRAIPVNRMIEDLRRDPAMPIYWGSNKPGMQAGEELSDDDTDPQWRGMSARAGAKTIWLRAMEEAIASAEELIKLGLHKQIANRLLEPWAHINVVVTATDYENFFTLRRHKDAQPEIKLLADLMHERMAESNPRPLVPGKWHLPYVTPGDWTDIRLEVNDDMEKATELCRKVSVARCARVSYLTHDGRRTKVEEDLTLYERLVGAQPLHASPAEHQATPDEMEPFTEGDYRSDFRNPDSHGNFHGWIQYRKTLPGEFVAG